MSSPFPVLPSAITTYTSKERFQTGELRQEWVKRYPQIFDEMEVQIAENQPEGHFCEWFAAVHLFETTGWPSLVESYQFKVQRWKRSVLQKLGATMLIEFFDGQRETGHGRKQAPDLLVYAPDFSDYYFCEVKGPTDYLRSVQIEYFNAMAAAVGGKRIVIQPVVILPQ